MEKWWRFKKEDLTEEERKEGFTIGKIHVLPEDKSIGVIGAIECLLEEGKAEKKTLLKLQILTGNRNIKITDNIDESIEWLENIEGTEGRKLRAAKVVDLVTNEEIIIVTMKEFFH